MDGDVITLSVQEGAPESVGDCVACERALLDLDMLKSADPDWTRPAKLRLRSLELGKAQANSSQSNIGMLSVQ